MPELTIRLNGESYAIPGAVSVSDLLARLDIDARRVAVEVNETVVKRERYHETRIRAGDAVEIVNFVGGG
jgi:sulfur carrier protein